MTVQHQTLRTLHQLVEQESTRYWIIEDYENRNQIFGANTHIREGHTHTYFEVDENKTIKEYITHLQKFYDTLRGQEVTPVQIIVGSKPSIAFGTEFVTPISEHHTNSTGKIPIDTIIKDFESYNPTKPRIIRINTPYANFGIESITENLLDIFILSKTDISSIVAELVKNTTPTKATKEEITDILRQVYTFEEPKKN